MPRSRILLIAFLSFILSACTLAPRVNTDFDTSANFDHLKTFAFAPEASSDGSVTTLLNKRVKDAITSALQGQGHQLVAESGADFLVAFHTSYEKRIDVDTYYTTWGIRPFWWYGPYHRAHVPTTRVREYTVGTLVVDIIDAKAKTVVWSSSAANTLSKSLSPQEREEKINRVVSAMIAEFPPQ
ncbi:DUF4136 domain-containing protein [Alteromonas sp. ASW11-36]|uniref:DUF4136 domain-containing protein n=1 Tax=Alteromonas arenosi TaxID=3055817 RepID=A0ABT7T028_9ALTE|nr:DUF4136 domain-containing protein [Alteromonas sp. ASW11-36]MDM7861792.1 DUF4136 domain-containing protein [Alteromonas sp. ASW11-36]